GVGWISAGNHYNTHNGDFNYHAAGAGFSTSSWTFGDLPAGWYELSVSWNPQANRASNAPFAVYDGSTLEALRSVDQRQTPVGFVDGTQQWFQLGRFYISSGTAVVSLSDAANGIVIADAARLVRLPELTVDGLNSAWAVEHLSLGTHQVGDLVRKS